MDDRTRDELAGVVDLFGGLTRDELADALVELAFKRGQDVAELCSAGSRTESDDGNEDAVEATIEDAIHDYYLVEIPEHYVLDETVESDDPDDVDCILAPGPVAFPTLPDGAEDLPHILDAPRRTIDREVLGASVVNQLDAEAEADDLDEERARSLLDVTYDAEAWASVELGDVRDTLESRVDGGS